MVLEQGIDRLWGLHCLNSIVQSPTFDESCLSEIAYKLDEEERKILEGAGIPMNKAEGTNNVADDGNYNIQVLSKALTNLGNYELVPLDKPGVWNSDLWSTEEAFLCNSVDHWFAIRKVHGVWFNLNSTNLDPGPQKISNFSLDLFLSAVKEAKYTVYTVKGDALPQPHKIEGMSSLRDNQKYLGLAYLNADYENNKGRVLNTDGADQGDMNAAIQASLVDFEGNNMQFPSQLPEDNKEKDDLAKAMEMSLGNP